MFLERFWWTAYQAFHRLGQARYPYKPLMAILRDQSRHIRAAVEHAYNYVPYYRETMRGLGLTPADFQSAADLSKLPLLERRQLQRDPEYFVTRGKPRPGWLKQATGGSSGAPVTVYHDTAALMRMAAYSHREGPVIAAITRLPRGYRQTVVSNIPGGMYNTYHYLDRHTLAPPGRRLTKQFLSMADPVEENLRRLNEFRPDILRSFGSYLALFFSYLEASGAAFHRPKIISSTGDRLPQPIRRLITDKYRIPVITDYGASEAPKIGFECEAHLGLHLNLDFYPLRLVDPEGREVPAGETGEVVVSDLVNRGIVILNYRLGDLAALLPQACPCGRTLPLLSFPQGRIYDFIRLTSRKKIHPMVVLQVFRFEQEIYQFQVVQKALDLLEVRLVPKEECNQKELAKRLQARFAQIFGPEMRVEVVFVSDVERTASGKVRLVISLGQDLGEEIP